MKLHIQRVTEASVTVEGTILASIEKGLVVLCGIGKDDDEDDLIKMALKLSSIRLFQDDAGLMNLNLSQTSGALLLISQFTLYASTKKGNRPSFLDAAPPDKARTLFDAFVKRMQQLFPQKVQQGLFGADMKVMLVNDGPVTIMIDSKNPF